MKLLDLFCGAGGAAGGYHRAGYTDITGVDINPQPDYPYDFRQADAMEVLQDKDYLQSFDLIHASPPCQAYSQLRHVRRWGVVYSTSRDSHPTYLSTVIDELSAFHSVIENVPASQAKIARTADLVLCGSHFDMHIDYDGWQLALRRHRLFWLNNLTVEQPKCHHDGRPCVEVTGNMAKMPRAYRNANPDKSSGLQHEYASLLMGIDWIPKRHHRSLSEAIPPTYTEYIGRVALYRQDS